ncbi:MAG: type II toxin-antitoxin system RelB/DinJ family antitoxin [Alphaproteobacteria bacterium]|nr:type II toxin-antitoxin system RelB/DinJ family antitoxin [Alphaproteobacteria bacterium]MBR1649517.1 type II toxin-antitoxin system RelB/DinJ family antitoxin [Alphaproteobacteria bacterium]
MVNLTVRIDENLKADAEAVLARLGLTVSDAVRLFLAQIRNTRSIPFELKVYDEPNENLEKIITEAEKENKAGKLPSFKSVEDLVGYLNEN